MAAFLCQVAFILLAVDGEFAAFFADEEMEATPVVVAIDLAAVGATALALHRLGRARGLESTWVRRASRAELAAEARP